MDQQAAELLQMGVIEQHGMRQTDPNNLAGRMGQMLGEQMSVGASRAKVKSGDYLEDCLQQLHTGFISNQEDQRSKDLKISSIKSEEGGGCVMFCYP